MQGTFALSYLVQLALSRIAGFFAHWYGDGTRYLLARYRQTSSGLEGVVASRTMLHLLFRPLYGDYSVVGRILGPIFRTGRLLMGGVAHLVVLVLFVAAWLAWIAVPPAIALYATGFLHR